MFLYCLFSLYHVYVVLFIYFLMLLYTCSVYLFSLGLDVVVLFIAVGHVRGEKGNAETAQDHCSPLWRGEDIHN